MKIHLQTIERSFAEEVYIQAEELLDQVNYQEFQEVEKSIWAAKILDQGLWEVEVELNGNYLKGAFCECPTYSHRNYCTHVVALLLLIRRTKEQMRKVIKATPERKKPQTEKFTVSNLVDQLSPVELKKFVKLYAKHDKDFSLALKTRFAGQIGDHSHPEKYLQILQESRRSNRRVGQRFSIQGQRNYLRLVDELLLQADSALKLVDFPLAAAILISVLIELPANLAFAYKGKKSMLKSLQGSLNIFQELISFSLAPALNETLWIFLINQLNTQGPGSKYIEKSLVEFLLSLSKTTNNKEELLDVVHALLSKESKETERYEILETARIDLMVQLNKNPFEDYAISERHPLLLLKILENLEQRRDYSSLSQTIDHALKLNLNPEIKSEVEEFWLRYAKAIRDKSLIREVAELRLIQSLDKRYIEEIKIVTDQWDKDFPKLLKKLEVLPFSLAKRDLIANILREEEKPLELMAYLENTGSLDLFIKHAAWLHRYIPEHLLKIYPEKVKNYAREHIGPIAAKKISLAMENMARILGKEEALAVKNFLIHQYKQRPTLMQMLETS